MKKMELIFLILLFVIGMMAGSVQAGGRGNFGGPGHGFHGGPGRGNYGGPRIGYYGGPGRGNFGGPRIGFYGGPVRGYYGGPGRGYYGGWGRGYYGGWWPGIYWGGLALAGLPWYPYNYYPQPSTVVQESQVYAQPQQQDDYYWYYCENPKGYYPYISRCPSGWMKVVPNTNPQTAPPN